MSDLHKLEILRTISGHVSVGMPARLSFSALTKSVGLEKQALDILLTELNKQRFISQYVKKGVDSFTVVLNQKGLEAVQDESFI